MDRVTNGLWDRIETYPSPLYTYIHYIHIKVSAILMTHPKKLIILFKFCGQMFFFRIICGLSNKRTSFCCCLGNKPRKCVRGSVVTLCRKSIRVCLSIWKIGERGVRIEGNVFIAASGLFDWKSVKSVKIDILFTLFACCLCRRKLSCVSKIPVVTLV